LATGKETMIRELIVWLDKVFGMNRTKKLMIRPRKYGANKNGDKQK